VKAVFADTFYWVALTNPGDSRYQDAIALDPSRKDCTSNDPGRAGSTGVDRACFTKGPL
jgi:hypothetical protein